MRSGGVEEGRRGGRGGRGGTRICICICICICTFFICICIRRGRFSPTLPHFRFLLPPPPQKILDTLWHHALNLLPRLLQLLQTHGVNALQIPLMDVVIPGRHGTSAPTLPTLPKIPPPLPRPSPSPAGGGGVHPGQPAPPPQPRRLHRLVPTEVVVPGEANGVGNGVVRGGAG